MYSLYSEHVTVFPSSVPYFQEEGYGLKEMQLLRATFYGGRDGFSWDSVLTQDLFAQSWKFRAESAKPSPRAPSQPEGLRSFSPVL